MRVFCCNPSTVEAEGDYFAITFPSGSNTVELVVTRHVLLHLVNRGSRLAADAMLEQRSGPTPFRAKGRG